MSSTPPNIEVDFTFTLTSSGRNISTPPKILVVFITISSSIIAFLKSHLIPPNIAVKLVPLNFSPSKFKSCPEKIAHPPLFFSLFLFSSFIFPFNLLLNMSLKTSDIHIITRITGSASFQIKSKSITSWQANNKATPTNIPIMLPVFSSSLNRPIKHGIIINNVHHPSKNMSM